MIITARRRIQHQESGYPYRSIKYDGGLRLAMDKSPSQQQRENSNTPPVILGMEDDIFEEKDQRELTAYSYDDRILAEELLPKETQELLKSLPVTASQRIPYEEDEMTEGFQAPPHGEASTILFDPVSQEFTYQDCRAIVEELMKKLAADTIESEAGEPNPYLKVYTLTQIREIWEQIKERDGKKEKKTTNEKGSVWNESEDFAEDFDEDFDENPNSIRRIQLERVLQEIAKPNMTIKIIDDIIKEEKEDEEEIVLKDDLPTYITELELKKLWLRYHLHSLIPRPSFTYDKFDMKEALLTIPDEFDEQLIPMDDSVLFSTAFADQASRLICSRSEQETNGWEGNELKKKEKDQVGKKYEIEIRSGFKVTCIDYERDEDVLDAETKTVTEIVSLFSIFVKILISLYGLSLFLSLSLSLSLGIAETMGET
jgi:hypothetical protein